MIPFAKPSRDVLPLVLWLCLSLAACAREPVRQPCYVSATGPISPAGNGEATTTDGASPGIAALATENPQQSRRIILRMRDARAEPTPQQLMRLGTACDARLAPIRPMSGGAEVVMLTATQGDADTALACLARQPEIDYAEPDARARPAAGGGAGVQRPQ
ncbi:hypothetical protein [Derxia gummosa]|uniref:Uncharacterized protein n=1 Tax=Derxia gummosa DSM 723 TaxID=1121388 RepID=A0A8B6X1E5_9BURK|nr:hypothetical protein [Derxia gummosa]